MRNFWKEKTYRPENEGYGLFSTEYFLVLVGAMVIVVAAILLFGRMKQNQKEKPHLKSVKKSSNTACRITKIIKVPLACMMSHIAKCIHGLENMMLLVKKDCLINVVVIKLMMK